MEYDLSNFFPEYNKFDPPIPIWCVTPTLDRTIHRFFDTSPFSPSGRFLGLTRLPYENRLPNPGYPAEVAIVDLHTGEERIVAETLGWDTQLGAQVQWGASDNQLLFNDIDQENWNPFGVVFDPFTGFSKRLSGTVYMVSPDGKRIASPSLLRMGITQPGYGVIVPRKYVPINPNVSDNDGLFITDTASGETKLLVSHKDIVETANSGIDSNEFRYGTFYSFHVKWNPRGDRLMLVLRWIPEGEGFKFRSQVVTMNADGSAINIAVPASEWDKGGHHPNWCPDGEHVMMNLRHNNSLRSRAYQGLPERIRGLAARYLKLMDNGMRFIRVRYDGKHLKVMNDSVVGSGHPSLHPNGQQILTDVYLNEPLAYGDGTTPIRLINLTSGRDLTLARVNTAPPFRGPRNVFRVDPHPAWDREFRYIAFNACVDGTRRVFIADLASVLC
jgi:hypothetical protein